jgi:hypothetical protein
MDRRDNVHVARRNNAPQVLKRSFILVGRSHARIHYSPSPFGEKVVVDEAVRLPEELLPC